MLYMVIERFKPGAASEIYRRVREHGRALPDGLEYIDSWVDFEYERCFQSMSTNDPALFDVWIEHWSDVTEFEVIPVRQSAEAALAIAERL